MSEQSRQRGLDRSRDRYAEDAVYREKVRAQTRRTAQKMHAELASNRADRRHGTVTGYFLAKCKCPECSEAMRAYGRSRRARLANGNVRRHRWAADRTPQKLARLRAVEVACRLGYSLDQVAEELGVHRGTASRYASELELLTPFRLNRLPKKCPSGHSFTGRNVGKNSRGHRYCRACSNENSLAWHEKHKNAGLPHGDPRHGTNGGYSNYGCRCEACTAAHSAYCAEYYRRTKRGGPR